MGKPKSAIRTIFLMLAALIILFVAIIFGLRWHNGETYTIVHRASLTDSATRYETNDQIRAIETPSLKGFHFIPEERLHPGVVVVYGGSEGSPDYERARAVFEQGYETLALYFWGQEGQTPTLANVPLEQFDEVETYIEEHVERPFPLTVIGTSKGAEFSAELAAHGFAIDNLVNFAPADHTYSGLDYTTQDDLPSFTYRGEPVPFASFRSADFDVAAKLIWNMVTNAPPSYRASYESAAAHSDDGTRIDLSSFEGNALFFAGEKDAMWQSDVAAKNLAAQSDAFEAHVYSDAGHVFSDRLDEFGTGWEIMLGGTVEGGAEAYEDSNRILFDRLARWHGRL